MANRDLLVINNRIKTVSQVYMDNSAILSTYVAGALILHNDISDAPYDGIDIGWGWGVNDAGGSPVYRDARRGYYDHPANLVYETPTLHRGVVVAYNRMHHIKKLFHDGGAIYNLSASPDTVIAENYIHDIPDRIAPVSGRRIAVSDGAQQRGRRRRHVVEHQHSGRLLAATRQHRQQGRRQLVHARQSARLLGPVQRQSSRRTINR